MKKLIILLSLFLAVSAFAETSPRRDSLVYSACNNLAISTSGTDLLTTTLIAQKVNAGIRQVCVDYPALPKYDTVSIDSSMENGALPSDFDRAYNCFMLFGDTLRVPMIPITADSLRKLKPSLGNNVMKTDDEPGPYFVIWDTTFSVYPKWRRLSTDSLLLIGVRYFALDTTLTTDSSETLIDSKYLDYVVYYVCASLEAIRGNYGKADYWWKRYGKQ